MGIEKSIKTPEELWDLFVDYDKETKSNPFPLLTRTPKGDNIEVKPKAITMIGFEGYLAYNDKLKDLKDYASNKEGRYEAFTPIIARIRAVCKADNVTGGMSNVYNSNLTARIHGIVEKQDITSGDEKVENIIVIGGSKIVI